MKKSILVLSLLLPTITFAQVGPTAGGPAPTDGDTPVAAAAPLPKEELVLNNVTSKDMLDGDLSLKMTKDNMLMISGKLPVDCADRISLSDYKKFPAPKSEEEMKDAVIEKSDDMKEYSSSIEVQVTYASDSKNPTLRDCIANHKSSPTLILASDDPRFSRKVGFSPELVIAGLIGEKMDVKSAKYLEVEAQLASLDCKDCNSNWKKARTQLDSARGFESPLLSSMMNKLLELNLVETSKKLETTTTLSSLEKIREQLGDMAKYATTDEQRDALNALYTKLIERNSAMAATSGSRVTKHADFEKDTYTKMLDIPNLPEEQRATLQEKAAGMSEGHPDRVNYVCAVDCDNNEIKNILRANDKVERQLESKMSRLGCVQKNRYNFTQCGELQNELNSNKERFSALRSKATIAYNQNWTNTFALWEKRGIAYNNTWNTSFLKPVAPIATKSLPEMYDPRDPAYKNFDPSKLYQVTPGDAVSGNLFTEQPFSVQQTS